VALRSQLVRHRALGLYQLGHLEEALRLLDPLCDRSAEEINGAEIFPDELNARALALLTRASIRYSQGHEPAGLHDLERSIDFMRQVRREFPARVRPRLDLARIQIERCRLDASTREEDLVPTIELLREMVETMPRSVAARVLLVDGLEQLTTFRLRAGDATGARVFLEEALANAEEVQTAEPLAGLAEQVCRRLRDRLSALSE